MPVEDNLIEALTQEALLRKIQSERVDDLNLPTLSLVSKANSVFTGYGEEEKIGTTYKPNSTEASKVTLKNFKIVSQNPLGTGSYAEVFLAERNNSKLYALKKIDKSLMIRVNNMFYRLN